jgi:Tfp pilus assembly protein PilN
MSGELNLLPPRRRRLLDKQSTISNAGRLIRHLIAGLVVLTTVGALSLVSLQLLVLTASRSASGELLVAVSQYRERREEIAKQNQRLTLMHQLAAEHAVWSDLLPDLFTLMPSGVRLEQLSGRVTRQDTRLSIEGRAVNRNTLIALDERLATLSWVDSIEAPHSNLIQRSNPDFSFVLFLEQ